MVASRHIATKLFQLATIFWHLSSYPLVNCVSAMVCRKSLFCCDPLTRSTCFYFLWFSIENRMFFHDSRTKKVIFRQPFGKNRVFSVILLWNSVFCENPFAKFALFCDDFIKVALFPQFFGVCLKVWRFGYPWQLISIFQVFTYCADL